MRDLYWLTDEPMARLQPYFSESHGKPRVDGRRVQSGIVFLNRNGLRWCDAPKDYGPHKTLYNRWKRWAEKGHLSPDDGGAGGRRCRAKDRHDRRNLPEGTPHSIEPAG